MASHTDPGGQRHVPEKIHLSEQEQLNLLSQQKQTEMSFPKADVEEPRKRRPHLKNKHAPHQDGNHRDFDQITDVVDQKQRKKKRKKKHAERSNSVADNTKLHNESNKTDIKPDQSQTKNQDTDEKVFPTSFAEGTTNNLIYFLQTKRYVLDDESCSPNVKLLNKNRPDSAQRQVSKKTTDAIRGAIGFRDGVHVFEFSFNDKPWGTQCTVGVCGENAPMHTAGYSHMIGNSAFGWVWDIPSRTLHHDGKMTGVFPENPYIEIPRTFRMTLAREQGILAFNFGQSNTVVFKDLPDSSVVLYPVVSMVYGLAEVTVNVISSDLLDKYMWLPRAATRAQKRRKRKSGIQLITDDNNTVRNNKEDKTQGDDHRRSTNNKEDSEKTDKSKVIPAKDTIADAENETAISIRAKLENDVVGYDSYKRDPGNHAVGHDSYRRDPGNNDSYRGDPGNHALGHDSYRRDPGNDAVGHDSYRRDPGNHAEGHDSFKRDPGNHAVGHDSYRRDPGNHDSYRGDPGNHAVGHDSYRRDPDNHDSYRRDPGNHALGHDSYRRDPGNHAVGHDSFRREQEESSADEDKDYDEETMRVDCLEEDDQLLFHTAHAWDSTNKGSRILPYPNAPHICVPMPNFDNRIQGIRSRRGFSGRGIHTWMIKELIIYSPSVVPEQMAYQRNNVIIGVATNEQRKYNFGYGLSEVGKEIWGFQYPDLKIWHGPNSYKPQPGPKNPDQISLEGFDFELANGLEMTLNTVRNRLTFVYDGKVLAELKHVKGEKLYPYVMYVKDAFYPLEINYVEGPRDYFEDILTEMHDISRLDFDDVTNKKVLMKRSSSMKENQDNLISRDRYIWGCHSAGIEVLNKKTVCNPGVAVAAHPLGGSRHKVTFHVDGTTRGFSIGFVHYGYPLQPVVQDELEYLGNDLLSWCWDIDKRELIHACRVISKYPLDESFDQDDVIAYTMTLDFSPLGYNTASFTVHLDSNDKATKELGIAFISVPPKVLPTVVIKGTNQKIRMEYTSGPWRTTGLSTDVSRSQPVADVTSRTCTIM